MATSTYNPNDANCAGWDGFDTNRPPTAAAFSTDDALTGGEEDTISVDDANSISRSITAGNRGPGQRAQLRIVEAIGSISQLVVTAKGWGDYTADQYTLWVWNSNSVSYEQLATHGTSSKDTVIGTLSSNFSYYIDGSNDLYMLVMAPLSTDAVPSLCYTFYMELVVTWAEAVSDSMIFYGANF